jgi:hypothetical protein
LRAIGLSYINNFYVISQFNAQSSKPKQENPSERKPAQSCGKIEIWDFFPCSFLFSMDLWQNVILGS